MSSHFPRSLRTLEDDSWRRTVILFSAIILFLSLWATWFIRGRVALYAPSDAARLEVDRESHPVDAPVAARIIAVHLSVNRLVKVGDVLLELDAIPERLARNQEQARLAPAASQLHSLKEELLAEERALEEEVRGAQAALGESEARTGQAAAAAELAGEEAKQVSKLKQGGLVSDLDVLRANNAAIARESDARSAQFSLSRLTRELETRRQDRLGRIARLKKELAALEGMRAEARAGSHRLQYSIDQRTLRAPISGTLAEVSPLTIGSMVTAGQRICTIVPEGTLKVVAFFAPHVALGRVRAGQPARVKLQGFPWTQYGSTPARVASVAGEPQDSRIRVELAFDRVEGSPIPFQHGLPADVDVEVERVSPIALVLRSIGAHTRVTAMQR